MTIIVYFLKVQVVFTILFMLYYAFFRKEKFLVFNRFVLIGIIVTAFLLPVLPTFNVDGLEISQLQSRVETNNIFPKFTVDNATPRYLVHINKPVRDIDYLKLAIITYAIVAAILLIIFLVNLYKVCAVIRVSRRHKVKGIIYCEPLNETPPFSFFNFIVVSTITFNAEQYRQIISHESAHSRQLHSLDVLIADMVCILLWINPLIYIYRRQLKLNLEFLADQATLKSGINARDYQYNLLRYSGMLTVYSSVNAFFTSKIKERILMINTERPGISKSYKYILLRPIALSLSVLVGFKKEASAFTNKSTFSQKLSVPTINLYGIKQPISAESNNNDKHLSRAQLLPAGKSLKEKEFTVAIDARTDTVKFSLVQDNTNGRFKGIYVIDNKIFSDDEIRAALKPSGKLQMILTNQPVIGMYTANDSSAIKKWGEQARPEVVFVTARSENPNK